MELLRIIDSKVTKNKNYENMPDMEINEAVLVHCNIANFDYEQDSKVLYTLVPNKPFDQVLNISPKDFMFSKPSNSEFSNIKIWFPDQNSKLLEIADEITNILVIN